MTELKCSICGRDEFASTRAVKIHQTQYHEQGASKEELIEDLQRAYEELGETPVQQEFDQYSEWSHGTVKDRFGTWNEALKAAGLELRRNEDWVSLVCSMCGDEFEYPRYKAQRHDNQFCSDECYANFRSENYHGDFMYNFRGYPDGYYGENWGEQRRKTLERDGWECRICGMSQEQHRDQHGAGLDVHHIVPFRLFSDGAEERANRVGNLVSLCRSCHVKIERKIDEQAD